ncbi:MAG: tryptophan-rich sensory protein [Ahniella sp.]|nr:tryptophan-rich sensory protein [Ahniella sp.]
MTFNPSRLRSVFVLIGCVVLCYALAAAGAAGSMSAPTFYKQLVQPAWSPPAWLFGPVWTLLYTMMAVSLWRVWRQRGFVGARVEVTLFLAQLLLNGLWSWLFFAWHEGGWAMLDIVGLAALIAVCIQRFWRIDRFAAWLLVPYLAWVMFASALNLDLWLRNPGLL